MMSVASLAAAAVAATLTSSTARSVAVKVLRVLLSKLRPTGPAYQELSATAAYSAYPRSACQLNVTRSAGRQTLLKQSRR
jgi:hypothetical protein